MNKGLLKKICLGLMLAFSLSTVVACGSNQDLGNNDDNAEVTADNAQPANQANDGDGKVVEIHNEASGGHLVSDGSFTSVSFDDGTSFSF